MLYKPRGIKLMLNHLLPKFPGSVKSRKIPQEELNDILLHDVPHGCSKQAIMSGFDFESEPFCAALELFKVMEVAELIYEYAILPSQTKQPRAYANQSSGWGKQVG